MKLNHFGVKVTKGKGILTNVICALICRYLNSKNKRKHTTTFSECNRKRLKIAVPKEIIIIQIVIMFYACKIISMHF